MSQNAIPINYYKVIGLFLKSPSHYRLNLPNTAPPALSGAAHVPLNHVPGFGAGLDEGKNHLYDWDRLPTPAEFSAVWGASAVWGNKAAIATDGEK